MTGKLVYVLNFKTRFRDHIASRPYSIDGATENAGVENAGVSDSLV